MKSIIRFLIVFIQLIIVAQVNGQIAINDDGSTAHSSAMLDVKSTTTPRGLLIPRMNTSQRTGITSPAAGLLVFDNTTNSFWFYSGSAWTELINSTSSQVNLWAQNGTHIYNLNSGNVGVGLSNPSFALQVYKNADVWHSSIGGTTGTLLIGGQTSSGAVIQSINPSNSTARDLYLQRDGGNVGIGTNNPLGKLHIGTILTQHPA